MRGLSLGVRLFIAVGLLAGGLLLAVYGLFAIVYSEDSGGSGDTYVRFGGRQVDADIVGTVALLVALIALFCAVMFLNRRRNSVKPL